MRITSNYYPRAQQSLNGRNIMKHQIAWWRIIEASISSWFYNTVNISYSIHLTVTYISDVIFNLGHWDILSYLNEFSTVWGHGANCPIPPVGGTVGFVATLRFLSYRSYILPYQLQCAGIQFAIEDLCHKVSC